METKKIKTYREENATESHPSSTQQTKRTASAVNQSSLKTAENFKDNKSKKSTLIDHEMDGVK